MSDFNNDEIMNELKELRESIASLTSELKLQREKYKLLGVFLKCAIWEYDIENKRVEMIRKLDGKWSESNLIIDDYRETVKRWGIVHPSDRDIFEQYCDSMDNGESDFQYDVRCLADSGEYVWFRYKGYSLSDENGKPFRIIGVTLDVTEEVRERDSLIDKAERDTLTRLYNKGATRDAIIRAMGQRRHNEMGGLIIVDIDDFKQINDTYGHLYGDEVLRVFSKGLTDVLSSHDIIGRIGGDEFIVYKPAAHGSAPISETAQIIIGMVHNLDLRRGNKMSVSVGVAIFPEDGNSYETLYKKADVALYNAKRSGKNSFSLYDHTVDYNYTSGETEIKHANSERTQTPPEPQRGEISLEGMLSGVEKRVFDFAHDVFCESKDITHAIDIIFREVLTRYGFTCGYICENNFKSSNVGIQNYTIIGESTDTQELAARIMEHWTEIEKRFFVSDIFCCDNIRSFEYTSETSLWTSLGVRSFVQSAIFDKGQFIAFISFENHINSADYSSTLIKTMQTLTKIISTYYITDRYRKQADEYSAYIRDSGETFRLVSYIINPETHEVQYFNQKAQELFPSIKVGARCYKAIMGRRRPCDFCPAARLKNIGDRTTLDIFVPGTMSVFGVTATALSSPSGGRNCALNMVNLSELAVSTAPSAHDGGRMELNQFYFEGVRRLALADSNYAVMASRIADFDSLRLQLGFERSCALLDMVSQALEAMLGDDDISCRYRDSCMLVMMDFSGEYDLAELSALMHRTFEKLVYDNFSGLSITFDVSADVIIDRSASFARHLDNALLALKYAAKNYNNYMYFFDEGMRQTRERELRLAADVADAAANDEFTYVIQPTVAAATGEMVQAEVFLRWNQGGNIIDPDFYTAVFAESDIFATLDFMILRKLFMQISAWRSKKLKLPVISVNIAPQHLGSDYFIDNFIELVDRYHIPHELLQLEFPSSALQTQPDSLVSVMEALRDAGFMLALDKFGRGYSIMNLLRFLPLNSIKSSRRWFGYNEISEADRHLLIPMIDRFLSHGIKFIAVGIEADYQVSFLRDSSCYAAQGKLYSSPLSTEDFERLLVAVTADSKRAADK